MESVKNISFWLITIIIISLLYHTRNEILNSKYITAFIPQKSYTNENGNIEFHKSKNGHFYITTIIHKQKILFLLDTGATDIILSKKDAEKIGVDFKKLKEFKIYHTANGDIKSGSIILPEIQIGNFLIKNIKVSVNQSPMSVSLLGMSFLKYFNFSINNDTLTLSPYIN